MLSLRLTFANMRKRKETVMVLALFLTLCAAFLDFGVSMERNMEGIYYTKTEQLHAPHLIAPCEYNSYKSKYLEYIENDDRISEYEKEETALIPYGKNDRNKLELGGVFFNIESNRSIAPFVPIEEIDGIDPSEAIYVPVQLKQENVLIGEPYVITYKGSDYKFRVAGYFESTYYCNQLGGFYKYYVHEELYENLCSNAGKAVFVSARFKGDSDEVLSVSEQFRREFIDATDFSAGKEAMLMVPLSLKDVKGQSLSNLLIMVALLVAMSFIICFIVIIIISNHIRDSINDSVTDIGVLESLGYTRRQLVVAYSLEFILPAAVACLVGVAVSYCFISLLGEIISGICGFIWINSLHLSEDIITYVVILSVVSLTAYLSSRRLQKLTIVNSLSKRLSVSEQKETKVHLYSGKGSLWFRLSLQNIDANKKSSVIYTVSVMLCSFLACMTFILFLNFAEDNESFLKATGYELSDLQISVMTETDVAGFSQKLAMLPEVRKTNLSSTDSILKCGTDVVKTIVTDDFGAMEVVLPYTGDYPKADNEVVISHMMSEKLGKDVGDSITLTYNNHDRVYIVSGIYSTTNGNMALMTLEGMRKIMPEFELETIDVYLNEGIDRAEFKKVLETRYKVSVDNSSSSVAEQKIAALLSDYGVTSVSFSIYKDGKEIYAANSDAFKIREITNIRSYAEGQINSFSNAIRVGVVFLSVVVFLIITCIMRIEIKTGIKKCRTEYGVYKAMGYTTKDLVSMISLRYLITNAVGFILGTSLSALLAEPLFQYEFKGMGVAYMPISIYPLHIICFGVILCAVLYAAALLFAYRVRHITPYDLLTE